MCGYDRKYDDIDENLGALGNLPTHIAHEFADWRPDQANDKSPPIHERKPNSSELSEAEKRYLRAVVDKPGEISSAYSKMARMSTRKALEIRKRLVALGYIGEHELNTAKNGRPSIVLEPTSQGLQKLKEGS